MRYKARDLSAMSSHVWRGCRDVVWAVHFSASHHLSARPVSMIDLWSDSSITWPLKFKSPAITKRRNCQITLGQVRFGVLSYLVYNLGLRL